MGVDGGISPHTQAARHSSVDKGSDTTPMGGFDNPTLYDMANIKYDALTYHIKQDRLVLGNCRHVKDRFEFGAKTIIPDL